jgi:hypothetical protein
MGDVEDCFCDCLGVREIVVARPGPGGRGFQPSRPFRRNEGSQSPYPRVPRRLCRPFFCAGLLVNWFRRAFRSGKLERDRRFALTRWWSGGDSNRCLLWVFCSLETVRNPLVSAGPGVESLRRKLLRAFFFK